MLKYFISSSVFVYLSGAMRRGHPMKIFNFCLENDWKVWLRVCAMDHKHDGIQLFFCLFFSYISTSFMLYVWCWCGLQLWSLNENIWNSNIFFYIYVLKMEIYDCVFMYYIFLSYLRIEKNTKKMKRTRSSCRFY